MESVTRKNIFPLAIMQMLCYYTTFDNLPEFYENFLGKMLQLNVLLNCEGSSVRYSGWKGFMFNK